MVTSLYYEGLLQSELAKISFAKSFACAALLWVIMTAHTILQTLQLFHASMKQSWVREKNEELETSLLLTVQKSNLYCGVLEEIIYLRIKYSWQYCKLCSWIIHRCSENEKNLKSNLISACYLACPNGPFLAEIRTLRAVHSSLIPLASNSTTGLTLHTT